MALCGEIYLTLPYMALSRWCPIRAWLFFAFLATFYLCMSSASWSCTLYAVSEIRLLSSTYVCAPECALRAGRHPALRSIRRRLDCPQPLLCTPKAASCSASAAIAALRIGFSNSACAPPSTILSVEPGQAARSRLAACYHVFDYARTHSSYHHRRHSHRHHDHHRH